MLYTGTATLSNNSNKRKKPGYIRKDPKLLLLILPFVILTFLFAYVPLFGWAIAFFDYKPAIPIFQNKFVGLDNFRYMLKDKRELTRVMTNTVTFAGLGYCVSWVPMLLAVLLNELRSSKYKRFVQTVTTFPNFISWVIVYALAFQMFSHDGFIATMLTFGGGEIRGIAYDDQRNLHHDGSLRQLPQVSRENAR